jgi:hypothetical protein
MWRPAVPGGWSATGKEIAWHPCYLVARVGPKLASLPASHPTSALRVLGGLSSFAFRHNALKMPLTLSLLPLFPLPRAEGRGGGESGRGGIFWFLGAGQPTEDDPSPACGPKPFGGRRPEGFGPAYRPAAQSLLAAGRSVRAGRPQGDVPRTALKTLRARFLSRACGIGMTAWAGPAPACPEFEWGRLTLNFRLLDRQFRLLD